MTKTPCIRPEGHPVPISAWVSPLGISFGHQVANDPKTGSGTTENMRIKAFWENWLGNLDSHMISKA
jgi:hypothetical protein